MFGLNLISDFRKESRPPLRESLAAAASGMGVLAARSIGSSGRGLFLAAALGAGVMGGLVPHVLGTHSRSLATEKLQKLESEQTADAQAVGMIAQANTALQARLDTLERRLSKVERASLDTNPTGAVAAPPPPKPDSKRKPPKN